MKEFNLLTLGNKYDYVLFNKHHPKNTFTKPNQSLHLVAFFNTHPDYKDIFGEIIIYNSFTRNTFTKSVLKDKSNRLFIKIKVQYFEKTVYLDEFKNITDK